jgi:hypothetical protein
VANYFFLQIAPYKGQTEDKKLEKTNFRGNLKKKIGHVSKLTVTVTE